MSMGEKGMQATTNQRHRRAGSPLRALAMCALAAVLAVGLLWPQHMVMAQAVQSGTPALHCLGYHHTLRPDETDSQYSCESVQCKRTQWTPFGPVPLIRGHFHAFFSH